MILDNKVIISNKLYFQSQSFYHLWKEIPPSSDIIILVTFCFLMKQTVIKQELGGTNLQKHDWNSHNQNLIMV